MFLVIWSAAALARSDRDNMSDHRYQKERVYDQQTQHSGLHQAPKQHRSQEHQAPLLAQGTTRSSTERQMSSPALAVNAVDAAAASNDRVDYHDNTGKYGTSERALVGDASNSLCAPATGHPSDAMLPPVGPHVAVMVTPEDSQQLSVQPQSLLHSTNNETADMTNSKVQKLSATLHYYKSCVDKREQQLTNMQWQLQTKDDQLQQLKKQVEAANQVLAGIGQNQSQCQGSPMDSTCQGPLQQHAQSRSGNCVARLRAHVTNQTVEVTNLKEHVKNLESKLCQYRGFVEQHFADMQWQLQTKEAEVQQLRKAVQAANQVLPGIGQNYAQLKGVVDASYPRDMVSSLLRNTLDPALQKLATCILHEYKQCATPNSIIIEEVEAVLDPVLRFIDPAKHNERIQKMALKSHLLHKLNQIVWNGLEPAGDMEQQLHAQLLTVLPPFQLRKAVLHTAPALKAATPGSSSRVAGNPAQLQLLNKLLDGQRQLSAWWYDAMTNIESTTAVGGQRQLQVLLQPLLLEFLQCLGLPSLQLCDNVVGNLDSVVSAAVLLRLCAEASHPCHALIATAGLPRCTDPSLFGGVDGAYQVYAGSQGSADKGEEARVVACAAPGVVHDARLMLLPSSAGQHMQVEGVVIATWASG